MHQYDSLTSGFLSPEDDLYPKTVVLEQGCHLLVSEARQWYFKALLPAHSLNRLWLSHGAPEKDTEQKKNGRSSGHGRSAKVLLRWKKMCNKIHPFSWTGNYRVNKTRIPDTIDSDTATGVIVTRRFSLLIIDPLDTNSSNWINAG